MLEKTSARLVEENVDGGVTSHKRGTAAYIEEMIREMVTIAKQCEMPTLVEALRAAQKEARRVVLEPDQPC